MERDGRELGRPKEFPEEGMASREVESRQKIPWESDQLIVLGDGRADHRGKGLTEICSLKRKHCPEEKDR
jgi:hypothetical protein